MIPVSIKAVLGMQQPISALVVNTQVRTGVNKIRREVQSSVGFYTGDTVELELELEPGEVYEIDDDIQVLVLSTTSPVLLHHMPNNSHHHAVVVDKQFMSDYLVTEVGIENISTTNVKVVVTFVPFKGEVPDPHEIVEPYRVAVDVQDTDGEWSGVSRLPSVDEPTIQFDTETVPGDTLIQFPTVRITAPVGKTVNLKLSWDNSVGQSITEGTNGPQFAVFGPSYQGNDQTTDGAPVTNFFFDINWPTPIEGTTGVPLEFQFYITAIDVGGGSALMARTIESEILTGIPPQPVGSTEPPSYQGWLPAGDVANQDLNFFFDVDPRGSYNAFYLASTGSVGAMTTTRVGAELTATCRAPAGTTIKQVVLVDNATNIEYPSPTIYAYSLDWFTVNQLIFQDGVSSSVTLPASLYNANIDLSPPVFECGVGIDQSGGGASFRTLKSQFTQGFIDLPSASTRLLGAVFAVSNKDMYGSSVYQYTITHKVGYRYKNKTYWFNLATTTHDAAAVAASEPAMLSLNNYVYYDPDEIFTGAFQYYTIVQRKITDRSFIGALFYLDGGTQDFGRPKLMVGVFKPGSEYRTFHITGSRVDPALVLSLPEPVSSGSPWDLNDLGTSFILEGDPLGTTGDGRYLEGLLT